MKRKLLVTLVIMIGFYSLAQEIPNRIVDQHAPQYIFEFDEQNDHATYKKVQGIRVITDFEILINGREIIFHSLFPLSNKNDNMKVNTTRNQLDDIIMSDNIHKQSRFYIFVKKHNTYYSADHLGLRTEIN